MKSFVYITLAVLAVAACVSLAAPEPSIVPGPDEWTVGTGFSQPQQINARGVGDKKLTRFWYIILTVTNKTGQDVDFYHGCDLMTDTFQIISADKHIPALVFEKIKQRHQSQYPFLESLERTSNKILQGEDNTKDIAIIWPDFDAKATGIKLFITGLSNETAVIDHPIKKDEMGRPAKVFLRKTLELRYALGGDPAFRSDARLIYKGKRWIMR